MTILWIILGLMSMAFFLLYPVVLMTNQFSHECTEASFLNRHLKQQEEKAFREKLNLKVTNPTLSLDKTVAQD